MPSRATIAILADVHGNLPALEVVLDDIRSRRPDEVLVGGDLVGRGPDGSRVVAAIRATGWPSIRGNHEDYLLAFCHRRVPPEWWREEQWAASRWMAAELGDRDVAWLEALPTTLRSELRPGLLLVHGTPESANAGLGPWSSDGELERHLGTVDAELLVCGHTHRPMDRELAPGRVVNVGSVGLPFNRDPRAQYALFHHDGDGWEVEFRRLDYDRQRALDIYERSGFRHQGGITAELLRIELEQAAPYLVPFLKWAEVTGREPVRRELDAFLDDYDPDQPLHAYFHRLRERAG